MNFPNQFRQELAPILEKGAVSPEVLERLYGLFYILKSRGDLSYADIQDAIEESGLLSGEFVQSFHGSADSLAEGYLSGPEFAAHFRQYAEVFRERVFGTEVPPFATVETISEWNAYHLYTPTSDPFDALTELQYWESWVKHQFDRTGEYPYHWHIHRYFESDEAAAYLSYLTHYPKPAVREYLLAGAVPTRPRFTVECGQLRIPDSTAVATVEGTSGREKDALLHVNAENLLQEMVGDDHRERMKRQDYLEIHAYDYLQQTDLEEINTQVEEKIFRGGRVARIPEKAKVLYRIMREEGWPKQKKLFWQTVQGRFNQEMPQWEQRDEYGRGARRIYERNIQQPGFETYLEQLYEAAPERL